MNWYQSVAGAEVRLSPSVEKRIGVAGFGVDDVGVLREPETVATILRLGRDMNVLSEEGVEQFTGLPHGSKEQVKCAKALGEEILGELGERIEKEATAKLREVPGTNEPVYKEYKQWAEGSLWELPVGCLENYPFRCFCLADDGALSVFDCPVDQVPGRIGEVLSALVEELTIEALKVPALEAISYNIFMGFDPCTLSGYEGFEAMRNAEGPAVMKWLEKADDIIYGELVLWDGSEESAATTACAMRDIAFAWHDQQQRIRQVVGKGQRLEDRQRAEYLKSISNAAKGCEPGALREFVLAACRLLAGPTTRQLIDRLPADERFERLPGEMSFVDTGLQLDDLDSYYTHINEIALNGDEVAFLPLQGDPRLIIDLLTRVTVCERLLIALGALLDSHEALSERKAA